MGLPIVGLIGALAKPVMDLIDDLHTSDEEKAEAKLKALALLQQKEDDLLKAQSKIIATEAGSKHWITAAWRPILMLSFTAIVVNNYILAPYIELFFDKNVVLELPPSMWKLLQIGMGGYVVGRSAEKVSQVFRKS